jgi:hypothetical protein
MLALHHMSKIVGTVKKSDLEGGHWILETEDGDTYQLHGKACADLEDGMKATVEGKIDRGSMGIGMTGPSVNVEKITRG